MSRRVSYYGSVSYFVRDHEKPSAEDNDAVDADDGVRIEVRKVKIKAGDIIEFLDASLGSFNGGRVVAIMAHERTAFLVITWIIPTGNVHDRLHLHEFEEVPLFHFASFHPLMIVDHQRFVNHAHSFAKLQGKLYLNDWVFEMV